MLPPTGYELIESGELGPDILYAPRFIGEWLPVEEEHWGDIVEHFIGKYAVQFCRPVLTPS
mgnify:CR=1 FL=1